MTPPPSPSTLDASAAPAEDHAQWFRDEVYPHEKSLRSYLRLRFPGLADLDDLIQDTYLRLVRERATGRRMNTAFLYTVARNAGLDWFRRKKVVSIEGIAEFDRLPVSDSKPNAAEIVSNAEQQQILVEAIQALPERCRQVITLRKIYGLSHHEIAVQLKMAENTVNVQVTLGMARMRDFLRSRGVEHGPRP